MEKKKQKRKKKKNLLIELKREIYSIYRKLFLFVLYQQNYIDEMNI